MFIKFSSNWINVKINKLIARIKKQSGKVKFVINRKK